MITSKHPLVSALKWLVAAVAIYIVANRVSMPGIWPAVKAADPLPLFACLVLVLLVSVLNAYRWKVLLRAPDLGLMKYLYFVFVGHFCNLFMPSSLASEAVKVIAFGRRYGNLQQNVGLTLVARGMGMLGQLLIGAMALALYFRELRDLDLFSRLSINWLWPAIGALGLATVGVLAFLYRRKLAAQEWVRTVARISRDGNLLAKTAALTAIIQVLSALSGYCLYLSVFPDAPFGKVVLFILIIQAILMIPFSMGGVGVREYLVILFFSDLGGMPPDAAMAANLLGYIPLIILAAAGGVWILFRRHEGALKMLRKEFAASGRGKDSGTGDGE